MNMMSEERARSHVGKLLMQLRSSNASIGRTTELLALASAYGRMSRDNQKRIPTPKVINDHDKSVARMVECSANVSGSREEMLTGLARCYLISYNFPPLSMQNN